MEIRLQKYLADSGVASRRASEKLITQGKIKVNDKIINELGVKVDPGKDKVKYNDELVKPVEKLAYLMLNKPRGYVTTVRDFPKQDSVMKLLPKGIKVHPIGRLDKNSEGLLIFTNDGELTQELTHPKYKHEKEYLVQVNKDFSEEFIQLLKKGIRLGEGIAKVDKIKRLTSNSFQIILHQGWKRQIRRMCEALDYKTTMLKRIRINKLELDKLATGEFKYIKREDIL